MEVLSNSNPCITIRLGSGFKVLKRVLELSVRLKILFVPAMAIVRVQATLLFLHRMTATQFYATDEISSLWASNKVNIIALDCNSVVILCD